MKNTNITDKIKTFTDVLKAVKMTKKAFNELYGALSPDTYAYEQIKLIVKVLNESKTPGYGEYGYYPFFLRIEDKTRPAGFRLAFHGYAYGHDSAVIGARLLFKNADLAKYAGKQFEDIYNNHITK